jgi:uncharacterized membrane protein YsdA (DUF1294 family)
MVYVFGPLALLVLINLITFWSFRYDKRQSRTGGWRISESTLLSLAFVGGSVGAKVAQRRYRHKTRKEPFRSTLNFICVLHCLAIFVYSLWAADLTPAILGWVR